MQLVKSSIDLGGKLLYLAKWSRPDNQNITRELSRHFSKASEAHNKAMRRVMTYCVNTAKKGTIVQPNGKWNGFVSDRNFEILGISDSDYAKDVDTRRSINSSRIRINSSRILKVV